jgi:hypothetical protein
MLSKAKGQILRMAATLQVLFNINEPKDVPSVIAEDAIKAAINIVEIRMHPAGCIFGRARSHRKHFTGTI